MTIDGTPGIGRRSGRWRSRRLAPTRLPAPSPTACCLGTMTWGVQNTEAEGHEQMAYALERGVTFWDTAEIYPVPPKKEVAGDTERIMGTFFKGNPGARDKVVLATKVKRGGERTALRARGGATPPPPPSPPPGRRLRHRLPAPRPRPRPRDQGARGPRGGRVARADGRRRGRPPPSPLARPLRPPLRLGRVRPGQHAGDGAVRGAAGGVEDGGRCGQGGGRGTRTRGCARACPPPPTMPLVPFP